MKRRDFIQSLALTPLIGYAMKLNALNDLTKDFNPTTTMPVLFVGHGSPMNAIENNRFSREMKIVGQSLPRPKAILMVSAHWETRGTFVTAQQTPPTIHDFGGFPQALFDSQYPAPGSPWLVQETQKAVTMTSVGASEEWGLDHGAWSVAMNMFPGAEIPIIQLSLDRGQGPQYHYDLARQLAPLRQKGVLIIGSGNMVHNLRMLSMAGSDFSAHHAHEWAIEANAVFKNLISKGDHKSLIAYSGLGKSVQLSVPTPEHYLPLLYTLALKTNNEELKLFNDDLVAGAVSMTSVWIG